MPGSPARKQEKVNTSMKKESRPSDRGKKKRNFSKETNKLRTDKARPGSLRTLAEKSCYDDPGQQRVPKTSMQKYGMIRRII